MSPFRYREQGPSTATVALSVVAGVVAGFVTGVLVSQRVGGIPGLTSRLRGERGERGVPAEHAYDEYEEFEEEEPAEEEEEFAGSEDELDDEGYDPVLEERVLEAFRNDPVLSERAIDIGSVGDGAIELSGWVNDEDEAEKAITIARGVPGVVTVVNRLAIGDAEERFADAARRVQDGDPALTETRWEGMEVGTGRRRQGTSAEPDRHADPRLTLENRWLDEREAMRNAADDTEDLAERRKNNRQRPPRESHRGEGGPVSPSGVPKADHVAHPETNRQAKRDEASRDVSERAD